MTGPEILAALQEQAATVLHAEGARVGLLNCPECHSVLLLDPRDMESGYNTLAQHAAWHDDLKEATNG